MKELQIFGDIGTATDFLQLLSNGSDEFDIPGFSLEDGVDDGLDLEYLSVPASQPFLEPGPSGISEGCSSPGVSSSDGSTSPNHSSEEDFSFTNMETSPTQDLPSISCLGSAIPLIKVETDTSFLDVGNDRRKKRKKISSKEEVFVGKTAVSLPREQLLEFSSEDLENFVNSIKMTRSLTDEEKKEISRQRRLIKNRESAMASRIRKKSHVDELEKQVEELKQKNLHLQARVTLLELQNKQLQHQVEVLTNKNTETPTNTEPTVSIKTESSMGSHDIHIPFLPDFEERLDKVASQSSLWDSGFKAKSMKATSGICLFILLFSFGLFFHNLHPSHLGLGQQHNVQRFFQAFSEKNVLDFDISSRRGVFSRESTQGVKKGHGRVLLSTELDLSGPEASPGALRNTCTNNEELGKSYEVESSMPSDENTPSPVDTSRTPHASVPVVAEIIPSVEVENITLDSGEIRSELPSPSTNNYKLY